MARHDRAREREEQARALREKLIKKKEKEADSGCCSCFSFFNRRAKDDLAALKRHEARANKHEVNKIREQATRKFKEEDDAEAVKDIPIKTLRVGWFGCC